MVQLAVNGLRHHLRARRALREGWSGFGDIGGAVELFKEARRLAPGDPGVLSGLAMALARQFNYDTGSDAVLEDAREAAASAVDASPHTGEPWLAVATLDFVTGDWPAAVRAPRTALDRAPGLCKAHEMLACIEGEAGRGEDASVRLETILSLDPTEVGPRLELARVSALLARWVRADQLLELPVTDGPSTLIRTLARARAELWRGEPRWDPVTLEDVARDSRLSFAYTYAKLTRGGKLDATDLRFTERVHGLPQRSRLRTLLLQGEAEILSAAGDRDGALTALERAVAANLFDLLWLDRCPLFDSVRAEPRFVNVRARVDAVAQRIDAALSAPLG